MASPNDNEEGTKNGNVSYEDGDMSIASKSDEFLFFGDASSQNDQLSPFLTTSIDQNELLQEILNSIRESTDDLDRALEEQGALQSVPNVKLEQKLEMKMDNASHDSLEEASTTAFDCQPTEDASSKTRRRIEKPRRAVAPTQSDEVDEEPLLLYDGDKKEAQETRVPTYKNEETEDQVDEFFTIRKNPFSVNHAEYISVKSQEYQDQFLDELFESDMLVMPTTPFMDASFSIPFLLPEEEEFDEDDLQSWLCFDSDTEYQEFKRSLEEKGILSKQSDKVEKRRGGAGREGSMEELPFLLGEENFNSPIDRGMKTPSPEKYAEFTTDAPLFSLERRQKKSDKVYYNDNGFIYSKRHEAPY